MAGSSLTRLLPALSKSPVSGTANITESADTLSSSGSVAVSGAASITEAGDSLASSASVVVSGSSSLTESGDSLSATGGVVVSGTSSVTESADTLIASGEVISPVEGTANITEAGDTLTASGNVPVEATASVTEASDSLSASGSVVAADDGTYNASIIYNYSKLYGDALGIDGSANITESPDTLSSSGTVGDVSPCAYNSSNAYENTGGYECAVITTDRTCQEQYDGEAGYDSLQTYDGATAYNLAGVAYDDHRSYCGRVLAPEIPSVVVTETGWLGGASGRKRRKEYEKLFESQSEEDKERERIELGIIEAPKVRELTEEKVKVKAKKENSSPDSEDYWSLVLHEYLLNEQIAKIQSEMLLNRIRESVINRAIAESMQKSLIRRQLEMEMAMAAEYQRIIEEDMIFVFSVMAEI